MLTEFISHCDRQVIMKARPDGKGVYFIQGANNKGLVGLLRKVLEL